MTKEYLIKVDSVVMEWVYFGPEESIVCYQHPDLVDACYEEYRSVISTDLEDKILD